MKYAQQIQDYINGNENIGERHEEPEAVKVSDPVANSGISDEVKDNHERDPLTGAQLRDIDPTEEQEKVEPTPKKKRGRPVGSKTKKRGTPYGEKPRKTARRNRPMREKLQHTISLTPELNKLLCDDCEEEFRAFSHQVQYIITQYYKNNGKL